MSIEGQGHFFTIYFPGFVCFVLYLAKISGERLQDHWSSGISNWDYFKYIVINMANAIFMETNNKYYDIMERFLWTVVIKPKLNHILVFVLSFTVKIDVHIHCGHKS